MTDVAIADPAELERFLEAYPHTEYIDAIFVDVGGIIRGKRYPRADLATLYSSGLQIPLTIYLLDITGDSCDPGGMGFTNGDPDGIAVPVADSLVPIPWIDHEAGQVLMTVQNQDGSPSEFDPRVVAARVVKRFHDLDLYPVIAFEIEFSLFDRRPSADGSPQPARSALTDERSPSTQVYGIAELDDVGDLLRDIRRACDTQRIPASVATKEFSPGQYEINLRHVDDPLAAADHCALLRHVVKNVARAHGLRASFLAKPFADKLGNGMHLHMSVLDNTGANIFSSDSELGSRHLGHAVAGLQALMAESMAIFAPNINAFRRFAPNMFTPLNTSWGANNRSLTFRVPGGSSEARRIEHRIAGADANPYLVLASALAGMHHGLVGELNPGPATSGNATEYVDANLPLTLPRALDRLATAHVLSDYLGARYIEIYRELKQSEFDSFREHISPLEYQWYL